MMVDKQVAKPGFIRRPRSKAAEMLICVQTRKKISNKKAEWQRLCFFIVGKFLYAVITVPVFPR